MIAETTQNGQVLGEYIYLGEQLLAMIRPGEVAYYFHNDHLGTPQVLTNDSQAISWKAVYAPFGEAVPSIQTVENPFRFPGQYYDAETGLHYNYHRYYDPMTGRYVTPDPIGLNGGINLFAYVQNNPLNLTDANGLSACKTCIQKLNDCLDEADKAHANCLKTNYKLCDYISDPKWRDACKVSARLLCNRLANVWEGLCYVYYAWCLIAD